MGPYRLPHTHLGGMVAEQTLRWSTRLPVASTRLSNSRPESKEAFLYDVGSAHGTQVNRRRIKPHVHVPLRSVPGPAGAFVLVVEDVQHACESHEAGVSLLT